MREISQAGIIRYLSIMNNGEIDFFLGSGASTQAGIPTGSTMVWDFKRQLYCTEKEVSVDLFKDLYADAAKKTLQNHFDSQGRHPVFGSPDEYAHYFELCYSTATAREHYIQRKVSDVLPSIGHLCLGDFFIFKKVVNVWTTNFDELIEAGIKTLAPQHSFNVYSSANQTVAPKNVLSSVIKLHGDYRYDHIKNTSKELQELETSMGQVFSESLYNKGLVVIGYSGSDESIMNILETRITSTNFLKYGLIWVIPEGVQMSARLCTLMRKACQVSENSCIVQIQSFDEFMHSIYTSLNMNNDIIENQWKDYTHRKLPIYFQAMPDVYFTKLNAFISMEFPSCMVFDTDITSWQQLRETIGDNEIIVALYASKIYCFDEVDEMKRVFQAHIKSAIEIERISDRILYHNDSIYIGLLYSLIKKVLINEYKLIEFHRNSYFDASAYNKDNELHCLIYEAVEISLSVYNGSIYCNMIPTVYITDFDNRPFERLDNQIKTNSIISKIYNTRYNEKLKKWNQLLKREGRLSFSYKGFELTFYGVPFSCGGASRDQSWPTKTLYRFSEPEMRFSVTDYEKKSINQLKGISRYAPIDCSYYTKQTQRSSIELAVISPKEQIRKLLNHLTKLNRPIALRNPRDGFLTQYSGFEAVFKRGLLVPTENDTEKVFLYPINSIEHMNEHDYSNFLKRYIDRLSGQNNYNIVVIYIPANFLRFRENALTEFNLHDAIKLYATDKSVKVQFIEERSIDYFDQCKVMWGLSTSLYAKAAGVLWQPIIMNEDTAYVGISYALSRNRGTCIGCSQLFDSTGTGIRMLLRKINDPGYWGVNPYMKCDEAMSMMSSLRDQYYKSNPTSLLKRVVVHKTTPFTHDEIKGFTQALNGIDNVELIQIQEYSTWRAIRYDTTDYSSNPASYAIHRGAAVPLDDESFLLWTHGCIQHDELSGSRFNYYKGGRGIPSPLLVKRFYGKSSGDELADEILMLSKMNWNSGDSLYKQLPVTLDFAKVLSRMSKQDEAIYNRPYDFRYFM
jgi:hypothetical protein